MNLTHQLALGTTDAEVRRHRPRLHGCFGPVGNSRPCSIGCSTRIDALLDTARRADTVPPNWSASPPTRRGGTPRASSFTSGARARDAGRGGRAWNHRQRARLRGRRRRPTVAARATLEGQLIGIYTLTDRAGRQAQIQLQNESPAPGSNCAANTLPHRRLSSSRGERTSSSTRGGRQARRNQSDRASSASGPTASIAPPARAPAASSAPSTSTPGWPERSVLGSAEAYGVRVTLRPD